jgi:8-oxo-dGTP pyrophosphatase MutT (NUDIX family)
MKNKKTLVISIVVAALIGFQQYIIQQQKKFIDKPSLQYLTNLIQDNTKYLDLELVKTITLGFKQRPNANAALESVVIRLLNQSNITMYGAHISDTLEKDQAGRDGYEIHPYRKAATGASANVVFLDKASGKLKVLLGMKYKNPSKHEEGFTNKLITFGGYMKPAPLQSFFPIVDVDEEQKDLAEEALLRGDKNYAYVKQKPLATKSSFDHTLSATAVRELFEETNILYNPKEAKQVSLSTHSNYLFSHPMLHMVVENFLFFFTDLDVNNIRPGSDIAKIIVVNAQDIKKDIAISPQMYGSELTRYSVEKDGITYPIVDGHGAIIEEAITKARELSGL